ncbi:hypothetical protein D3C76_1533150 [compost metagenome]
MTINFPFGASVALRLAIAVPFQYLTSSVPFVSTSAGAPDTSKLVASQSVSVNVPVMAVHAVPFQYCSAVPTARTICEVPKLVKRLVCALPLVP